MIYSIENKFLKVCVKSFGCEITSIQSKETGFEYLWQGNPEIWSGQAPILFPIIGRLIDDKYTLDGQEYEMEKHGFARRNEWRFLDSDGTSMSFVLTENEKTLKNYPFCFELIVRYTLEDKILKVSHDVINKSNKKMYFSLGAHPAFNCAIGDKLVFDQKETLNTVKIDLEKSLRLPDEIPVLNNETDIIITEDIFNEDALILSEVKSDCLTLKSDKHNRKVKFNIGNAPYLGIWAKPGAPYVCIEPWFGVNDSQVKKADFSEKDAINTLEPDNVFNFTWTAEFSE